MKIKKNKLRSLAIAGVLPVLAAGGFLATQALKTNEVKAATIPDSCFYVSYGGTNYRFNQPECITEDLVVPKLDGATYFSLAEGSGGFYDYWNTNGKALKSITVSEGYQSVRDFGSLFMWNEGNNTWQVEVNLPSSLRYIDDGAFKYFQFKDGKVNLPEGLLAIGYEAFEKSNLNSITLPSVLTHLGERSFGSTRIQEATLPASLAQVAHGVFINSDIRKITIEGNPEVMERISVNITSNNGQTITSVPLGGAGGGGYPYNPSQGLMIAGGPSDVLYDNSDPNTDVQPGQGMYNNIYFAYTDTMDKSMQYTLFINSEVSEGLDVNEIEQDPDMARLVSSFSQANITNPTSLNIRYVDEQGNEIAPQETWSSKSNANVEARLDKLVQYLGKNYNFELTTADLAYVRYWAGLEVSETTDKQIAGYTLLTTDPQTITLERDSSKNVITFVYKKNPEAVTENPTTPVSPESSAVETPNTGVVESKASVAAIVTVFAVAFTLALTKMVRARN